MGNRTGRGYGEAAGSGMLTSGIILFWVLLGIGAGLASPLSGGLVRGAVALAVFAAVLTLLRAWPAAAIAEVRSLVRSRRTHVPSV